AAERPLVYVGGGVRSPQARHALAELAEALVLPVAHSLMGKGCLPDDHPLVLGMLGFWGTDFGNAYARRADLLLPLGTRSAETDANPWDRRYGLLVPPTRLIHVDVDAAEIGRNYPVELGAVANLDEALPELRDAARQLGATVERPGLRESIVEARAAV